MVRLIRGTLEIHATIEADRGSLGKFNTIIVL